MKKKKTKNLKWEYISPSKNFFISEGTLDLLEARWIQNKKFKNALEETLFLRIRKEDILKICAYFNTLHRKTPSGQLPELPKDQERFKEATAALETTLKIAYLKGKKWRLSEWARGRYEKDFEQLEEVLKRFQKILGSFKPRRGGKPKRGEQTHFRLKGKEDVEFYLAGQLYADNMAYDLAQLFRSVTDQPHDRIAYQFFQLIYEPFGGDDSLDQYKKFRAKLEKKPPNAVNFGG